MSCCCNLIPPIVTCRPSDPYKEIIKMLNDLEVNLNAEEIEEMKQSRELWCDFIPMQHAKSWYNVRIGCDRYSILRTSDHEGFN